MIYIQIEYSDSRSWCGPWRFEVHLALRLFCMGMGWMDLYSSGVLVYRGMACGLRWRSSRVGGGRIRDDVLGSLSELRGIYFICYICVRVCRFVMS
jgi:hypothetical protein